MERATVNRPVIRSPQAETDLEDVANNLAKQSLPAALRFLDAAELGFAQLANTPEIGGRYETDQPLLADLRIWSIPGFSKYLIFYRFRDQRVEVARVLHGSRDVDQLLAH
jgi:toxin ParE1/3/4